MEEKRGLSIDPATDAASAVLANSKTDPLQMVGGRLVKFEILGEEMIEKIVNSCGNSGRVYLPADWIGHKVKIARVD